MTTMMTNLDEAITALLNDQFEHGEWGRCEGAGERTQQDSLAKPNLFTSSEAALALVAIGGAGRPQVQEFLKWVRGLRQNHGWWQSAAGSSTPSQTGSGWVSNIRHTAKALDVLVLANQLSGEEFGIIPALLRKQLESGAYSQFLGSEPDIWSTLYVMNLMLRILSSESLVKLSSPASMATSEWQSEIQTRLDAARAWLLIQLIDGDHWSVPGSGTISHWVTAGVVVEIGAYIAHTRKDVCQGVSRYLMENEEALKDPRVLWGCVAMWVALNEQQRSSIDAAVRRFMIREDDNTLSMACSCRLLALGDDLGVAHRLFEEANWHSSALRQWKAWEVSVATRQATAADNSYLHSESSLQIVEQPRTINLLLLTALTEEAQVVRGVLDIVATRTKAEGSLQLYEYWQKTRGTRYQVATASAHSMGAVAMGIFTAQILKEVRPRSVALVGIAASVNNTLAGLGDVPFASHVLSYDDIAVQKGVLTFRTQGFPVDPAMRTAVGELRSSYESYGPWQRDCVSIIGKVTDNLNRLRKQTITPPNQIEPPHLIVELVAGGPFLLRDKDFRDALTKQPKLPKYKSIKMAAPVHPKLVSVEMESHGFMHAAHELEVPASVLKGISDVGDVGKARLEKKTGGFFRAYACSNAILAALHALP